MSLILNIITLLLIIKGFVSSNVGVIIPTILCVISICCFLFSFKMLGNSGMDPSKRQKAMKFIVFNGILTAITFILFSIMLFMLAFKLFLVVSIVLIIFNLILKLVYKNKIKVHKEFVVYKNYNDNTDNNNGSFDKNNVYE